MWTVGTADTITRTNYRVFRSGQKRGVYGAIMKELRRRSVVEPVIGHLKSDGHLGGNYLKGELGDKQNALFTAAGYNFRLLLTWFRRLFGPKKRVWQPAFSLRTPDRTCTKPLWG